ncbi:MAG: 4Fe-4S binding protein [Syntrophomonadaceae bacterium]|nr:4Fe-4S binding protein [Syntrophomonadaceae bacterium]
MERYAEIDKHKQAVLEAVARLALQGKLKAEIDGLPYILVDRDGPVYRCCIYHERAILAERIRLAMGLDRRKKPEQELERLSDVVESALALERIEDPVVVVIDSACEACPIDRFMVTDACRNCTAQACQSACPRQAIVIARQRAYIDQDRCIECGKCAQVCPFHAIVEVTRPCMRACGVGAIQVSRDHKAIIDYRKCVSCGHCIRACPFGAVAEKSGIVQLISMLKKDQPVYAIVAPSFIGQFGRGVTPEALRTAFKTLGFTDMIEVAQGADLVAYEESREFIEQVPATKPFVMNTCCPAFRTLVEKQHPKLIPNLFDSLSPMVVTGQIIKSEHPEARVVFIGPCVAKKMEALQGEGREMIEGVLTFEEMMAVFRAADIDVTQVKESKTEMFASRTGRLFARAGGVTEALISTMKKMQPEIKVEPVRAEGLSNCEKLLRTAQAGRLQGNLIEGMACPGGCVGGPGALIKNVVGAKLVNDYSQKSPHFYTLDNPCLKEWDEKLNRPSS